MLFLKNKAPDLPKNDGCKKCIFHIYEADRDEDGEVIYENHLCDLEPTMEYNYLDGITKVYDDCYDKNRMNHCQDWESDEATNEK